MASRWSSIPGVVRRAYTVRGAEVTVCIVEGDISRSKTDGVVNAANESSFTPMDGGISGALRDACSPDVVVGQEKKLFPDDDDAEPTMGQRVPSLHAGAQPAAGRLAAQGKLAQDDQKQVSAV